MKDKKKRKNPIKIKNDKNNDYDDDSNDYLYLFERMILDCCYCHNTRQKDSYH